ncbi:MAG: hypothetical protein Kow00121_64350 [Elainellaceae cyanobacterium]
MKSYNYSESNYVVINSQELDTLLEKAPVANRPSVRFPSLEQLWNLLLDTFAKGSEPRIYQKRDRYGKVFFQVYDPISGRSSTLDSEQQVRMWLDQRYYD